MVVFLLLPVLDFTGDIDDLKLAGKESGSLFLFDGVLVRNTSSYLAVSTGTILCERIVSS